MSSFCFVISCGTRMWLWLHVGRYHTLSIYTVSRFDITISTIVPIHWYSYLYLLPFQDIDIHICTYYCSDILIFIYMPITVPIYWYQYLHLLLFQDIDIHIYTYYHFKILISIPITVQRYWYWYLYLLLLIYLWDIDTNLILWGCNQSINQSCRVC